MVVAQWYNSQQQMPDTRWTGKIFRNMNVYFFVPVNTKKKENKTQKHPTKQTKIETKLATNKRSLQSDK